jgi:hypothetical protein
MDGILTLNSEGVGQFAFYLASVIVIVVNLIKAIFYRWGGKWKGKEPGWIWVALAVVVSTTICVVFKLDIIARIVPDLPTMFTGYVAYVISGLAISLSTNVLYKLAIKSPEQARADVPVMAPPAITETIPEPVPTIEETPRYYKTKLLSTWQSGTPTHLLIERDNGKKTIIELSGGKIDGNN